MPKGRIEPGECPEGAARRETLEETGIGSVSVVPGFHAASRYRFTRGEVTVDKTVEYFLAEAMETDVRLSEEHSDGSWFAVGDALDRLTYAEAREILRRADAMLTEGEPPEGGDE